MPDGATMLIAELRQTIAGLALVREVSDRLRARVLASGELLATHLGANFLKSLGLDAAWFDARTALRAEEGAGRHEKASMLSATCNFAPDARLRGRLDGLAGIVVTQGFIASDSAGDTVLLGRGGSDTSAVALAAFLNAEACEIYTDVEGVFTTDPGICPEARKLARISYDEMIELASTGAKVLEIRSVEFAKRFSVPVHVRSTFADVEGTWVVKEDESMDDVLVSGVSCDQNEAKITLLRVPDRPGLAAQIFGPIASAHIVVDMIIQNASEDGTTDVTFTVPKADYKKALSIVEKTATLVDAKGVKVDTDIAKISVVGVGMRTHAGVAAKMFEVLAREGINIEMISTSEIKISVVVDAKYTELAVRVLHDAFIGKRREL